MAVLADRLKELRKRKGLTQRKVADSIGIAVSTLGMYESGNREPDVGTLKKLARFYGVTVDYLTGYEMEELSPEEQLLRLGAYLRGTGATEEDVDTILKFLESRRKLSGHTE